MSSAPIKSSAGKHVRAAHGRCPATSAPLIDLALAIAAAAADYVKQLSSTGWRIAGCAIDLVHQAGRLSLARRCRSPTISGGSIEGRFGIRDQRQSPARCSAWAPAGGGCLPRLSVVALVGIFTWLFVYQAAHDRWLTVALGFVTGGILGNLYDRLGLWDQRGLPPEFHHGVRDWILFVWPEIKLPIFNPWPNFNIADSLLVTGAIMLVVHAVVWRESTRIEAPVPSTTRRRDRAPLATHRRSRHQSPSDDFVCLSVCGRATIPFGAEERGIQFHFCERAPMRSQRFWPVVAGTTIVALLATAGPGTAS